MNLAIPHSRPSLGDVELRELVGTIESGFLAPGARSTELGRQVARRYDCRFGLAVNSCTSALHLALLALGITRGGRVAVPALVCPSILNPIRYVGAEPFVVDIRAQDHQIDLERLHEIQRRGRLDAVIVPHRYGHLLDVEPVAERVPVIEDWAHSLGATLGGNACALRGRIGVVSFYATKMIATGCGGALVTSDDRIAAIAARTSDYYQQDHGDVRYNYRMPDLNAGVGLAQLAQLDEFIDSRRRLAQRYVELLRDNAAVVESDDASGSVWYRFIVRVGNRRRRDEILARSEREGCGIGTIDILPPSIAGDAAVSASEWASCVSLPIYPRLSEQDQERIVACVRAVA